MRLLGRLFGLARVVAQVFQPAVSPTFSRQTVRRLPAVFFHPWPLSVRQQVINLRYGKEKTMQPECASQAFRPCQRRSAGFPTCRIADFQSADRPKAPHRVPSILGHFRCVSKLSTCATERRKPCNLSAHLRPFGLPRVVAQVFQPAVSPTFSRQTVRRLLAVFLPSLATFGASAGYQPALRQPVTCAAASTRRQPSRII